VSYALRLKCDQIGRNFLVWAHIYAFGRIFSEKMSPKRFFYPFWVILGQNWAIFSQSVWSHCSSEVNLTKNSLLRSFVDIQIAAQNLQRTVLTNQVN
jgi:hypothetical protein